jgi:hypothetical protein
MQHKSQKNNRSPRPENIIVELFKIQQNVLAITLHKVIFQLWEDEIIPEQWEGHMPYLQKKKRRSTAAQQL